MSKQFNTDSVKVSDREAAGNQPDNSTPTGSVTPGGGGSPTGPAGGDLAGTYPNPTLKVIGAAAGPIGDSTHVARVTIDAKGRVIALASVGIAGISPVGTPGNYQRVTTNTTGNVTAGQNDVINVRQYGAVGDGVTDDLVAIDAAIAALTDYSTLYFPPGNYLITGQLNQINSITGLTIMGDGYSSRIFSNVTGTANFNTFIISSSCSYVNMFGLQIVGSATIRGSGIHIRMYASFSRISNCYVEGCSDFAIHLSNDTGTAVSQSMSVSNCTIKGPLGDGIHVAAATDVTVENNILIDTGDDSIAVVADDPAYPPSRVSVVGNAIYNSGARGIAILECDDFLVEGNSVNGSQIAGIEMDRFTSTTAYNTRGIVKGNSLYNTSATLGPIGTINIFFCEECEVSGNLINDNVTGAAIAFLDVLDVSITGNIIRNAATYGIRGYTFGAAHVATTQGPLYVKDNIVESCTNDAYYIIADVGCTLFNVIIDGNLGQSIGSGTFILYDQINTGRVVNNTRFGDAITAGGSVVAVTLANNN